MIVSWKNKKGKKFSFNYKRKSFPKSTKKAKTIVRKVLYANEPYKYDAFTASNAVGNTWTLLSNLSNIPYDVAGTTNSGTRQTTKILLKNHAMRGKIFIANDSTEGSNTFRLAIVRGRRAGALNMTDIKYGTGNDIDAQFNQKFVDVVWDKTYNLQYQAEGSVYPPYKYIDINTALNKIAKFTESSTDTETSQPYNNTSYYLIACSDSNVVPHPSVRLVQRMSFKQLD